jgi:hypothetical protein
MTKQSMMFLVEKKLLIICLYDFIQVTCLNNG